MTSAYGKLMFGTIWETKPDLGMARVEFAEDRITSALLPYLVQGSADTKFIFPLPIGAQVACLMDEHCEYGVILGPIYSEGDTPDGGSEDVYRVVFKDGAEFQYDTAGHRFTAKVGDTQVEISEDGVTIKRDGESLFDILKDLLTAIKAQTHTTSTGPSGPPINLADYVALENRLPNLFEG